jgi:hypothetical protein
LNIEFLFGRQQWYKGGLWVIAARQADAGRCDARLRAGPERESAFGYVEIRELTSMGLFFWRKNRTIDVFASALADEFYSAVQPEAAKDYLTARSQQKKPDKLMKKIDRMLEDVVARVQQFRTANALGVYGKARLHLKFTERLKELGYDAKVASQLNEMLLLRTP